VKKLGNTSTAVMQRRHDPLDSLDDFPTPPWGSRLFLAEVLEPRFGDLSKLTAWEPTCNRGYMARPMAEVFGRVIATDIADYGWEGQQGRCDFLKGRVPDEVAENGVDVVMMNPPFAKAEEMVLRALALKPRAGVVIIARSAFLEGEDRLDRLFGKHPLYLVAQSSQRIPMVRGQYDPQVGSATAYSWFVWKTDYAGDPLLIWTPKFRDRYKRKSDVKWEKRDQLPADWIAEACNDTPLFAQET